MNIFSKLKKRRETEQPERAQAELLIGERPIFTPFSGRAYENDIYRAANPFPCPSGTGIPRAPAGTGHTPRATRRAAAVP